MRFLLLSEGDAETWDSWSGSSRSVVDHLRAEGHTVTCGDVELYGLARYLTAARVMTRDRRRWAMRFRLGPEGFRARSARAQRIIDRHASQVDAIIQIGATFAARPPAGLPLVLYCDSNFEYSRDGAQSGFSEAAALPAHEAIGVRAREASIYESASRIFTMSERLRQVFIDRFGIPAGRVETLHAGVNFRIGEEPAVVPNDGTRGPVILFVGRAFERKGGDILLDAFRLVRERVPDARLLILGPDAIPGHATPGPVGADGVELMGYVDKSTPEGKAKLDGAYSSARVFCLPTRFEALGIVYLEAMYHELPCVGPRAWAVPEMVDDGVTGLLVPPDDRPALAEALVTLLTDPARAQAMGKAGAERLRERFTWTRVARKMAAAIEPLVAGRSAR